MINYEKHHHHRRIIGHRFSHSTDFFGKWTPPFVGAYCGSKAALEAMSDVLRRELSAFGVQVVIVQPGPIKTPIWEKARQVANLYPETEYANALKSTLHGLKKAEQNALPVEMVGFYFDQSDKKEVTRFGIKLDDTSKARRFTSIKRRTN